MKKVALVITMFLVLFVLTVSTFANTDPEYDKALKYYYSGKYKEAVTLLKEYVKKHPEPEAYYRIGYALYELGRYDEANEYFKEAYLIDPMFSPEIAAPAQISPEQDPGKISKPPAEQAPAVSKTAPAEARPLEPGKKPEPAPQLPAKQPEPRVVPQGVPAPPMQLPPMPMPKEGIPKIPSGLFALMAGFMTIFIVMGIALYIYMSLCHFLIAKKLNVPASWMAWVPILQIWPPVGSAGKPWWWILLLFIPFVNFFVSVYLYMCISENLGRNKWLGLLILVPIVNFIWLGVLAFSKTESPAVGEASMA
ncbi:MAG: tetratricopeptide repeat protein [Nitrospirota bacterium]